MQLKKWILAVLMIASVLASIYLQPEYKLADDRDSFLLETVIPKRIGQWTYYETLDNRVVDPVIKNKLDRIYSQILSRTYVSSDGYQIMLVIAYGEDQRSDMAVHYPEVCYPAQGFQLKSIINSEISLSNKNIAVKRLEAYQNARYEPITYWTTIGDYVSMGGVNKRFLELRYGLKGIIPDGLLLRVSSIDDDSSRAYNMQTNFIKQLIKSLPEKHKKIIIGV
jgi:EpsI family protein